jgi:hypothetical protein
MLEENIKLLGSHQIHLVTIIQKYLFSIYFQILNSRECINIQPKYVLSQVIKYKLYS